MINKFWHTTCLWCLENNGVPPEKPTIFLKTTVELQAEKRGETTTAFKGFNKGFLNNKAVLRVLGRKRHAEAGTLGCPGKEGS